MPIAYSLPSPKIYAVGVIYQFNASGNITSVDTFTTGANAVVQIIEGSDGKLYYVDLDDGLVGSWQFV